MLEALDLSQLALVVAGALIAMLTALAQDSLRERRQRQASVRSARRDVVELYLPQVLDLLAGLQWLEDRMRQRVNPQGYANPFPPPPGGQKVPNGSYPALLRLSRHPALSATARQAAHSLVIGIEAWNAVVEDEEEAADQAKMLIERCLSLTKELEGCWSAK